jgi:hypothetical protein
MTPFDRRDMMRLSLIAAAATSLSFPPDAPAASGASPNAGNDGARDFDWLIGSWRVRHRRLKERLANNNEWIEFDGTCSMRTLLGGCGNVDDNWLAMPGGAYRAVGLRAFDPQTKTWAIWWLDGRYPATLDKPVVGGFTNGVGTFMADDTFKDRPIKVRFEWSKITPVSAQWEQAFSPDGGHSWEMNWHMDFTRTA